MTLEYPKDLKYSDEHEYVRLEGDIATIGISAYAVDSLGEIVFVELPEKGDSFAQDDETGSIESVKAVSEIYTPVSGEVIEVNEGLEDTPEILNEDPYEKGWLFKMKINDPSELDKLMSSEEYLTKIAEEKT